MKFVTSLLVLVLALGIIGISGCTSDALNSSDSSSSSDELESDILKAGNISDAGAQIVIKSSGSWGGTFKYYVNGSVETNGNTQTMSGGRAEKRDVSGSGNQVYSIMGTITGLQVEISKDAQNNGELIVEIWENGKLVETKKTSTSDPVTISIGIDVPML
ncbi:hypothetical protein [Methanobacterium oryzae]|uniref:hypothetical protein n=1 Tax=Methanobacterium oryzae TaxID=69540 RepID=UPI003D1BA6AA